MKIAIPFENGTIFQHFGHAPQFRLYTIKEGEVVHKFTINADGSGHDALANLLAVYGVDVVICGGIGSGAQMALAQAGIRLYGGATGNADAAVQAFLAERLPSSPAPTCGCSGHHHEGGEHHCGHHGCGGHGGGCCH